MGQTRAAAAVARKVGVLPAAGRAEPASRSRSTRLSDRSPDPADAQASGSKRCAARLAPRHARYLAELRALFGMPVGRRLVCQQAIEGVFVRPTQVVAQTGHSRGGRGWIIGSSMTPRGVGAEGRPWVHAPLIAGRGCCVPCCWALCRTGQAFAKVLRGMRQAQGVGLCDGQTQWDLIYRLRLATRQGVGG